MTTIQSTASFMPSPPSTSMSSNVTLPCTFDDSAFSLLLEVVYSLFFIFGLVGNLFALWVFLFLHTSCNSVRIFLINCAVADLILLACLPFRVAYYIKGNQWVLGPVACLLVEILFYMNMYISITLLGLISLDRYLRLRGKSRGQTGMRLKMWGYIQQWSWVVCGALWGLSLMGAVVMISTTDGINSGTKCFQYKRQLYSKGLWYFNAVLVFLFWVIFIMIVVSYAKIASQLLRVSRDKPDLPNAKKYNKTAKKSFFVLFLFTICFGPYHAFRPVYIYSLLSDIKSCDYLRLMDRTNEVMLVFSTFNSCLDPVMYFLLSGSVRKAALQTMGHWLGGRSIFHTDQTSFSSTVESRRPSMQIALPDHSQNTPSQTANSICVSTLQE